MNYQNAKDVLERLANQHQGLVDLAAHMADLGGLESSKAELTAQVEQLRLDIADQASELLVAKHKVEEAKAEALATLDAASTKASDIVSAAEADAAKARSDAMDGAQSTVAQAQAQAQAILVQANLTASTLQGKVEELTSDIAVLEDKKTAVQAAVADAQAKLDDIKAQIAKVLA